MSRNPMLVRPRWALLTALAVFFGILTLASGAARVNAQAISPSSVEALVFPGESINVGKTVTTPEIPPNPDIIFLADTTGSMGGAIGNVQTNATTITSTVLAAQPTAQFAVAQYRDFGEPLTFNVDLALTADTTAVQTAINGWSAGGGGDTPEAQLNALFELATGAVTFRTDSTPIIVWFGDASGHDPSGGHTLNDVINALVAAEITVIAVPVTGADGLDSTGQATAITSATGGSVQPANPDTVADAILAGLSNLPAEVAMVSDCTAPIGTSFAPASQVVTSGDDAFFTETISVAAGAAGGTYTCEDSALINGNPMTDAAGDLIVETKTIHVPGIELTPETDVNELGFDLSHTVTATITAGDSGPVAGVRVEFEVTSGPNAGATGEGTTNAAGQVDFTITPSVEPSSLGTDTIVATFTDAADTVEYGSDTATKDWVDTTPPDASCSETVNPHGNTTPPAGSTTLPGPKGGQNEDGFYLLEAEDVVWPADSLQLFITDDGSGTVFGPYAVGTIMKYTQDADTVPEAKNMGSGNGQAGAVDVHIIGNGDAVLTAVDGSGNVSDGVFCLVPEPPK